MSMDEIKEIAEKLRKQGKMIFPDGATEDKINEFEKTHALLFLHYSKYELC